MSAKSAFAIDVPESLLAEARRGELAAFERIYRLFEQPAYTLALRLLGDREEAQDAMQDSMLRIFRHLSDFRGDAPFWGWLRQITLNESLMRLRRRGRLQVEIDTAVVDDEDVDALLPPAAADAQQLIEALQDMPETTRTVLWLFHAEGYTHDEIARLLGHSVSFSKSQLARGTRRLREQLRIDREVNNHA